MEWHEAGGQRQQCGWEVVETSGMETQDVNLGALGAHWVEGWISM